MDPSAGSPRSSRPRKAGSRTSSASRNTPRRRSTGSPAREASATTPPPSRPSWRRRRRSILAPPRSRPAPAPSPPSSPSWGATCGTTASRSSRTGPAPGRAGADRHAEAAAAQVDRRTRTSCCSSRRRRPGSPRSWARTTGSAPSTRKWRRWPDTRPIGPRPSPRAVATRPGSLRDAVRAELEELGMPGATFESVSKRWRRISASRGRSVWSSGSPRIPASRSTRRQGRVGRGALPRDARVPQRARGPRRRRDARLRRDRRGHRWARGPRGRPAARPSRRRPSGARRDHLPQIACFADRHLRVSKEAGAASVEVLDGGGRAEELSRMLAGLPGSESAVSHAEELLAEAERVRSRAPATVGRGGPSPDALARLPSNHSRDGRGTVPRPGKGCAGLQAAPPPDRPPAWTDRGPREGRPAHQGPRPSDRTGRRRGDRPRGPGSRRGRGAGPFGRRRGDQRLPVDHRPVPRTSGR